MNDTHLPKKPDSQALTLPYPRLLPLSFAFISSRNFPFTQWFNDGAGRRKQNLDSGRVLTLRDVLSWVDFINAASTSKDGERVKMLPCEAFMHGAHLVHNFYYLSRATPLYPFPSSNTTGRSRWSGHWNRSICLIHFSTQAGTLHLATSSFTSCRSSHTNY